jgi:hypothetical protein
VRPSKLDHLCAACLPITTLAVRRQSIWGSVLHGITFWDISNLLDKHDLELLEGP